MRALARAVLDMAAPVLAGDFRCLLPFCMRMMGVMMMLGTNSCRSRHVLLLVLIGYTMIVAGARLGMNQLGNCRVMSILDIL